MDTETGLIYLRARYYDPSVGRFISKDPFPAIKIITQGINRYVYVENNPVNYIGPSGLIVGDYVFKKGEWSWTQTYSYIDISGSGFIPTSVGIGPGGQVGIIIVPSNGVFLYFGPGVGFAGGGSATINIGEPPSEGWEKQFTVATAYGPGGQISLSDSGLSIGGGLGLEFSGSLTYDYYKKIYSW